MPQAATENAELEALDHEIAEQKKHEEAIIEQQRPVTTEYSWVAPERDYTQRSKRWYVTTGVVALVFIILAALTANYLLILTIIALVVVIYTINTIPPHDVTHQITNKGIYSFQTLFLWRNMIAFWITHRGNNYYIHIEYRGKISDMEHKDLIILVGKGNLEKIVTLVVPYVDYLGPEELSHNSIIQWGQGKYVPLLEIVGNKDVHTKDPNDSPAYLRTQVPTAE